MPEKNCFNFQHLFVHFSWQSVNINAQCPRWLVFCGEWSYSYIYYHFKYITGIVCTEYCASFLNLKFKRFFSANKIRAFGTQSQDQCEHICLVFALMLFGVSLFWWNVYLIRNERCRVHNASIKTNLCLVLFRQWAQIILLSMSNSNDHKNNIVIVFSLLLKSCWRL